MIFTEIAEGEMCSVSLDLNFGGYEAGALEESILPGPAELNLEITKGEGEIGFYGHFFSSQNK